MPALARLAWLVPAALAPSAALVPDRSDTDALDAPVPLTSGGEPIDLAGDSAYTGPGFGDVDGDGRLELVVGALAGFLHVYAATDDAREWTSVGRIEADGEAIELDNW